MNIIQSLLLFLIFLWLFQDVNPCLAQALPIRSLAKGAFSGIKEARREIIKDPAQWEKVWKQHATAAGSSEKIPPVDFSKEMVIAATMGTRRTGGYSIEIRNVAPTDKTLKIWLKQTSPPPEAITVQALTAPFHFVAVPKSDLKPEFVEAPDEKK
jgi:PrcB C-terminal